VHYQVIYDVRTSFPEGWDPLIVLVPALLIGAWIYRQHRAGMSAGDRRALVVGCVVMFCSSFGTLFVVTSNLLPYMALRVRLHTGAYLVLEGTVTNYRSGNRGTRLESWTLQTPSGAHEYAYSISVLGGGYDGTADRGDLLANGASVRVFDVDGRIARLEVAH